MNTSDILMLFDKGAPIHRRRSQPPFDAADHARAGKIDHIDCAIAEFRHEQALASEVNRQMIDAAANALQRNGAFNDTRRRRLRGTARACRHAQNRGQEADKRPHQLRATLTLSSAARRPLASFSASSFAQKCMKKSRGSSSSM